MLLIFAGQESRDAEISTFIGSNTKDAGYNNQTLFFKEDKSALYFEMFKDQCESEPEKKFSKENMNIS
jgi:hypothetical protein